MDVKELRMGNLAQTAFGIVEYRGASPDKPNLLFVKYSNEIDVREHIDDIRPIPLTEEWLKRFGFDEDGFKQYEFTNWGIKVKKDPHAISEPNWIVFNGFMSQFSEIVSVKHVHQLQNLFYCLCGEELELKP